MSDWEPSGLGKTIFTDRYARSEEETWQEACRRVADHVASAEHNGKFRKYADRFYDQLVSNKFNPGGRIWYGCGRPMAQLLNCFVLPTTDSAEGWGQTLKEVIVVSSSMGGIGINVSPIRGRGTPLKRKGGVATGAVSLMQMINGAGDVLVGGGGRRMALMLCLDINHPDLEEFLNVKLDLNQLNNANVSVVLPSDISTEDFQRMVENGEEIEVKFNGMPTGKTINAKTLWNKLVENAWKSGEPGFLNGYVANKMNNIAYYAPLISTNPCITGDTLIAVADGRNAISIKQLVGEGKDVPVYCSDPKTGQTIIRTGRNPRLTGEKKEVWKVTLDDGSIVRATPNHKFMLRDGTYIELCDLKAGDSLRPFNSYESNGYRQIAESGAMVGKGGRRRSRRQYRLIWEHFNENIADRMNVHHRDFNKNNDSIENLELMTEEDHRYLHSSKMVGEFNPYHRMSEEWKFNFASHPGTTNPKYIDVSNEAILDHGRLCWEQNNGNISQSIWAKYAKSHGLPQSLSNDLRFGNWSNFKNAVAANHKVGSIEFDCYEDVYNITVDDVHNYHIITSHDELRSSGICIKNCGEIWLEAYGCCDLGALVLPRFVSNGKFNWDEFDESIRLGVRFLDDVLTVNHYPLPEIEENCQKTRRIGLGVMGLHSMLLELGLKYSSKEAHEFVDKLFSFIKNTSYDESTILAVEKGPFPAYKPEFLDGGFAKTLKRGLRNKIKEHGIRNCALLTIAPTGTTSMVSDVSSGIEPLPAPVYWRTYLKATADGRKEKHRDLVVRKEYHDFPDIIEGAADLTPRSHFEMQKIVQSHIDNAVSKTINLPTDYPMEELADIWLEYLPHMKGSTFYRWGTREDEPIKPVKIEDAQAVIAENQANVVYDFDVDTQAMLDLACVGGVCDVPVKWAEEAASIS